MSELIENKPIFATSLVDIDGLRAFWGKAKDYVNGQVGSFSTDAAEATGLCKVIEDNEKVTAAALTDLDSRVNTNTTVIGDSESGLVKEVAALRSEMNALGGIDGGDGIGGMIDAKINALNLPNTYLKIADEKIKSVDTTESAGVKLTHDANGKLGVSVSTGTIAKDNGKVVTGGDVYTAVTTAISTSVSSAISASVVTFTASGDATSDVKKYVFKQGDTEIGTINIPKDLVVTSGAVVICEKEGDNFGKKCLELTLTSGDIVHIPVNELVDVYTSGNGVDITDANVVSVKLDAASESFLTVGVDGVKLSGVQTAINGAVDTAKTYTNTLFESVTVASEDDILAIFA